MPLPNDGIPPDRFELSLRFIFGALTGGVIAGVTLAQLSRISMGIGATGTVAGALIGGLLARHYGDRFWRALRWWV